MPCRSEYMEPTARELEATLVAQLLIYLYSMTHPNYDVGEDMRQQANSSYPDTTVLDTQTASLCRALEELTEEQKNRIIWDGRNKDARKLAEWWERHQEFDKKRKAQETRNINEHLVNNVVGLIKSEQYLKDEKGERLTIERILEMLKGFKP